MMKKHVILEKRGIMDKTRTKNLKFRKLFIFDNALYMYTKSENSCSYKTKINV